MSMFSPDNLNLARQFMAGPRSRPDSPYAGQYPNMMGFSQSPMGRGLMQRVLQQIRQRKLGIGQGRWRGTPEYEVPTGPYIPPVPYPIPTRSPTRLPGVTPATRQVKRETTEYFDGMASQQGTPVGRRP